MEWVAGIPGTGGRIHVESVAALAWNGWPACRGIGGRIAPEYTCERVLRFPVVKVLDYAKRLDALLADPNPFALVTAAHLLTQRTRRDMPGRYAAKWRLARLLYERDWDRQRIIDLFAVIDWLLHLPQDLERQLWAEIMELERTTDMRYVTSVERIGREEGRKEGRKEGEAVLLRRQLLRRFGAVPAWAETRLQGATTEQLEAWGERILDATTLDEVFGPEH